ncbi:2-haloacid dehalogenase [Cryobacterium flavum]|uniref:2-haloacid dehalogenase n=1 Tax=Cryobacterium flavum TaxID=1424659 RepID=A0A4R8UYB6_9MICO|nr:MULTISPECIES: haloacid dehalogenase type II [Cryobacterium]TFB72881.1 haloacid dehalogenase type II [Cryobacterium flavum]SDO43511.1 2-haloacid dehalogenase [Cryobacterium flavum]
MNAATAVIVFDVNETLSDMLPMESRFVEVGAPGYLAHIWFAALLRDGFALAASGGSAKFSVIGTEMLHHLFRGVALTCTLDEAVSHVLEGLSTLKLHPDVADGVRALKDSGYRLATLSNGSARLAQAMLTEAGIRDNFDTLLTVEDAPAWKPVGSAYHYAAKALGVQTAEMLLVAVHPWDTHGAAQAGLRTAWINRGDAPYPSYFAQPDYTVPTLHELAARLNA